ncbi:MAG: hypothetical protein COY66_05785 [Candidatus Kerfeldbacteria bacterium CG_4_10_14_0_8_um_filter_42_10]|uniref:Uncharacterized protein n=1 Tax=Candidatus Kerfeldbacteria bacterium CG_4_10_14_0_8_um_filter_42_10 TaxID=2014248 RepID=A0A2M7RHH2_9BACT|nr:MAG: hypothetical protein COY66_05785 [Candidatus Kerfeldbacteria bacterium CG_4_10_14_0_8_um_filter_42_10]
MPIKNYTTKVPVVRTIKEIQESLIKHGVLGILMEYEKGTGRIEALKFLIEVKGNKVPFRLPTDWRKFQEVLKQQGVKRWNDDDYCYRVAWRVVRDWVMAQMALFEINQVELPQIFLPYMTDLNGVSTLYERVLKSGFKFLGDGNK